MTSDEILRVWLQSAKEMGKSHIVVVSYGSDERSAHPNHCWYASDAHEAKKREEQERRGITNPERFVRIHEVQ